MSETKTVYGYGRIALLIDGDNCSPVYLSRMITALSGFGTITIKKVFADWSRKSVVKWKEASLIHHITPVQEFTYKPGKNASDIALIIDAMKMCFANEADCFCIASSDSDFISLVLYLQSQNKKVIIVGKADGAMALVKVCDVYIDERTLPEKEKLKFRINDSEKEDAQKNKKTESPKIKKTRTRIIPRKQALKIVGKIILPEKKKKEFVPVTIDPKVIDEIFNKTVNDKTGIAHMKKFMKLFSEFYPGFNFQKHGFNSQKEFLESLIPNYELVFSANSGTGIKKSSS